MMTSKGYFSKKAADEGRPIAIYLDTKGNEVEVTAVYTDDARMQELYHYDDVVKVGELGQFVRRK